MLSWCYADTYIVGSCARLVVAYIRGRTRRRCPSCRSERLTCLSTPMQQLASIRRYSSVSVFSGNIMSPKKLPPPLSPNPVVFLTPRLQRQQHALFTMILLFDTEVALCHQHVTCQERRSIGRGSVISMLFEANQRHHVWNQDCHEDLAWWSILASGSDGAHLAIETTPTALHALRHGSAPPRLPKPSPRTSQLTRHCGDIHPTVEPHSDGSHLAVEPAVVARSLGRQP